MKGQKTQEEMKSSRNSDGKVREIKHIDLYKLPAGQKGANAAGKKLVDAEQV